MIGISALKPLINLDPLRAGTTCGRSTRRIEPYASTSTFMSATNSNVLCRATYSRKSCVHVGKAVGLQDTLYVCVTANLICSRFRALVQEFGFICD
jgi:hypothetical protein